jgi:hypothetical protein
MASLSNHEGVDLNLALDYSAECNSEADGNGYGADNRGEHYDVEAASKHSRPSIQTLLYRPQPDRPLTGLDMPTYCVT